MQEMIRLDLGKVNCYLGKQGESFILFDTGGHLTLLDRQFDNRREALFEQLEMHGCTSENLKLVVLTHGDNDHTNNAAALKREFGAKIAIHKNDQFLVENPTISEVMKSNNSRSIILKTVMLVMKTHFRKVTEKTLESFERFTPDILLSEGDSLSQYGFDAMVLHLPGHTPGSIAIKTANGDLICGDIFINYSKPGMAPNAFDFSLLKESVERIKQMDIRIVYPGHGKPFEGTHTIGKI